MSNVSDLLDQWTTAGEVARTLKIAESAIERQFQGGFLDGAVCPKIEGVRFIPRAYLPIVAHVIKLAMLRGEIARKLTRYRKAHKALKSAVAVKSVRRSA